MSTSNSHLNPQQRAAATSRATHTAIQAGPGAGKTKTLIHRIEHLVERGLQPSQITAITFTNKAAREIRERLEARGLTNVQASTFHKLALEIIQRFGTEIGLPTTITPLDDSGKNSVIRQVLREHGISANRSDGSANIVSELSELIESAKLRGESAERLTDTGNLEPDTARKLYATYEGHCRRDGTIDFAGLLLLAIETLQASQHARDELEQRAAHLLIDEFQDVSEVQYTLMRAAQAKEITIVGDPRQSIYGWRGALPDLLERFKRDYPQTEVFEITLNYRCAPQILELANALIDTNLEAVTTAQGQLEWLENRDEYHEAERIAERIATDLKDGLRVAVLCRSTAQLRPLEQVFARRELKFELIGHHSYWSRVEIKLAIGILQLNQNPYMQYALEYLITHGLKAEFVPGLEGAKLGDTSLEKISSFAAAKAIPLLDAFPRIDEIGLRAPAKRAAQWVYESGLPQAIFELEPAELVETTLREWGYIAWLESERRSDDATTQQTASDRLKALGEFAAVAKDYSVAQLLEMITLTREKSDERSNLQLLTVHASKGLEWDSVYIPGMSQGTYPAPYSRDYHEEERLLFVAITRAKTRLTISRFQYHHRNPNQRLEDSSLTEDLSAHFFEMPPTNTTIPVRTTTP